MPTKICFTGKFKETCEYGRKGTRWKSGYHGGTDLVGIDSEKVYSVCNGVVERAGYDNGGFGNYVRIKEDGTENRIYLAHLSKIYVKVGDRVTYTTVVGLMGSTGNSTGKHTHVEIREFKNGIAIRKLNASTYMGIPNVVGEYNSADYQIQETNPAPSTPVINNTVGQVKKFNRATTLYSNSNLTGSKYNYKANTTVEILENVSNNIDKVKVRVTGRIAYVDNTNLYEESSRNTVGQIKTFKDNTIIYSNSNLTGKSYNYLPNTTVEVLENTSSNVDKVKVRATSRTGYVSINVYK